MGPRTTTSRDAHNKESTSPLLDGPAYPLTRDQFADALPKGLGRALLHVQQHGAAGLEDIILTACLHNQAYDAQCEAGRSDFVFEVVSAAGLIDYIAAPLIEKLRTDVASNWQDGKHRCAIAHHLHARGYAGAKDAIYACFLASLRSKYQAGIEEIIALDGTDGLIFVTRKLGALLIGEPDHEVDFGTLYYLDEAYPPTRARAVLDSVAATDADVRRYLARLDQLEHTPPPPPPPSSLSEAIAQAEQATSRDGQYAFERWGRTAPEADLDAILQRLPQAANPFIRLAYIACFLRRLYPPARPVLIEQAEFPDLDVRRVAILALRQHAHPDVRALALRRIDAGRFEDGAVALLRKNYAPGDHARLESMQPLPSDRDVLHHLGSDVIDMFEANPVPEAQACLVFVYAATPCSNCRRQAVELLIKLHIAPDWLLHEAHLDSDSVTRAFAAGRDPDAEWQAKTNPPPNP